MLDSQWSEWKEYMHQYAFEKMDENLRMYAYLSENDIIRQMQNFVMFS